MRKIFITCMFLMFAFLTYGQLSESFEAGKFGKEWTFYHVESGMTGVNNSWNIAHRDSLPSGLKNFPVLCGKYVAYAQCGGGAKATDSWMITPQVTIKEGDYLKFTFADPLAYGMSHDTLDIMISETTTDVSAFTSRIMRIIPRSFIPWKETSVDLSQFAGKKVHIGFRDYHYAMGSFVKEYLFLDNISISDVPSYDLSVESLVSPISGCSTQQTVKVMAKNNGGKTDRFTMTYKVGQEPEVSEIFDRTLNQNEDDTFAFATPVTLSEGKEHSIKIWIKNSLTDSFVDNDTVAASVKIGSELAFPYKMTDDNGASSFTPIGSTSGAWQFSKPKDKDRYAWVLFGQANNLRGALVSNCIPFTEELVMLSFTYRASHDVTLILSMGAPFPNASIPVDTILLSKTTDSKDAQIMLRVPKGSSSIGFMALFPKAGWRDYCEFVLQEINIDAARTDLAAQSIVEPTMTSLLLSEEGRELKAVFHNTGAGDVKVIDLCYQLDNEPIVRESVVEIIPEKGNLEYTFNQKVLFDKEGNHTLKVWSQVYGDVKVSNDSVSKNILVYQAKEFPFTETFIDPVENAKWSIINEDNDDVFWAFMKHPQAVKEGSLVYKNSISGIVSNDYFITPAIKMPKGKARLSFYFATSEYNTGTGKLKVLMGTDPNPKKMTKVLFDRGLTNTGWLNGYELIDVENADNYYFAFYGYGTSGDIYLDYVKVDAAEDLCMSSIAFAQTSGFNKTNSDVIVSFVNHGISAQSNIPISYFIEGKPTSIETITDTVLPGDTIFYTFKKQADISIPDSTYRLMCKIEKTIGEDTFNDSMIGWAVEHWANKEIPYFQNFEKSTDLYKWTVPGISNGWLFQNNMFNAYGENNFMYHGNNSGVANDWIYSECIDIPKGTYELSFFYRTMKNMDTDPYKQKFKVMLGTGTSEEKMSMLIVDYDHVAVATPAYKKHNGTIEVTQAGKYYIGFYNYSNPGYGGTYIDNLELKPVETGTQLPYVANFATEESDWTKYNPSYIFDQWTATKSGFDSFMSVNRVDTYKQPEGLLLSPALKIDADKQILLTIDYAVISEADSVGLNLYMGNVNNSDSMVLVTKLPRTEEFSQAIYEFKSSGNRPYYFGLRSNSLALYELKLSGFKAEYKDGQSIENISSTILVSVSQKDLHIQSDSPMQRVRLMDVTGRTLYDNVPTDANQVVVPGLPSGIYIVTIEGEGWSVVRKVKID